MSPSVSVPNLTEILKAFKLSEEYVCFRGFSWTLRLKCDRVSAEGARTHRSLGYHLLHPQNFDQVQLVKEAKYIDVFFCVCDRRKDNFGERKFV